MTFFISILIIISTFTLTFRFDFDSIIILIILAIPLGLKLISNLLHWRVCYLLQKETKDLKNELECIARFFIFQNLTKYGISVYQNSLSESRLFPIKSQRNIYLNGLMANHYQTCIAKKNFQCLCKWEELLIIEEIRRADTGFKYRCNDGMVVEHFSRALIEEYAKSQPNSLKSRLIIIEYTKEFGLWNKAYLLLQNLSANHDKLNFTEQLLLYSIKKELDLHFSSRNKIDSQTNLEIISLIKYFEIFNTLKDLINKQMSNHKNFWAQNIERYGSFEISNIKVPYDLAIQLTHMHDKITKEWNKLVNIIKESIETPYLYYALYTYVLGNSNIKGDALMEKFNKICKTRNILSKFSTLNEHNLFSEENMYFIVSAETTRLGLILDCSNNVNEYIGIPKNQFINKHIDSLLPIIYRRNHIDYITSFIETGKCRMLNKTRKAFYLDQEGSINPCLLHVKHNHIEKYGIVFLALIRPILDDTEYILIDENGMIDSCTKQIGQDLNFNETEFYREGIPQLNFYTICPEFSHVNKAFNDVIKPKIMKNSSVFEIASIERSIIAPDAKDIYEKFTNGSFIKIKTKIFHTKRNSVDKLERLRKRFRIHALKWLSFFCIVDDDCLRDGKIIRILKLAKNEENFDDNFSNSIRNQTGFDVIEAISIPEEEPITTIDNGNRLLGTNIHFDALNSKRTATFMNTKSISCQEPKNDEDIISISAKIESREASQSKENLLHLPSPNSNGKLVLENCFTGQKFTELTLPNKHTYNPKQKLSSVNSSRHSSFKLNNLMRSVTKIVSDSPYLAYQNNNSSREKNMFYNKQQDTFKLIVDEYKEYNRNPSYKKAGYTFLSKLSTIPFQRKKLMRNLDQNIDTNLSLPNEKYKKDALASRHDSDIRKNSFGELSNVSKHIYKVVEKALNSKFVSSSILWIKAITLLFCIFNIGMGFYIEVNKASLINKIDRNLEVLNYNYQRVNSIVEINKSARIISMVESDFLEDNQREIINVASLNKYSLYQMNNASLSLKKSTILLKDFLFTEIDNQYKDQIINKKITIKWNLNDKEDNKIDNINNNLTTLEEYMCNLFDATNILISRINDLIKSINSNGKIIDSSDLTAPEMILQNTAGNFLTETVYSSSIFLSGIENSLSKLSDLQLLIAIFGILMLFLILCCYILHVYILNKEKISTIQIFDKIKVITAQKIIERIDVIRKYYALGIQNFSHIESLLEKIKFYDFEPEYNGKARSSQNKITKSKHTTRIKKKLIFSDMLTIGLCKDSIIMLIAILISGVYYILSWSFFINYKNESSNLITDINSIYRIIYVQGASLTFAYEYIQNNGTGLIMDNNISIVINQLLDEQSKMLDFVDVLEKSANRIPKISTYIHTDACFLFSNQELISKCYLLTTKAGSSGLISMNAFMIRILTIILSTFETSDRSIQSITMILGNEDLMTLDVLFSEIIKPAYSELINLLNIYSGDNSSKFQTKSMLIIIIYMFLWIMSYMCILRPLTHKFEQENKKLKRLYNIIPIELYLKNKALNLELNKKSSTSKERND